MLNKCAATLDVGSACRAKQSRARIRNVCLPCLYLHFPSAAVHKHVDALYFSMLSADTKAPTHTHTPIQVCTLSSVNAVRMLYGWISAAL